MINFKTNLAASLQFTQKYCHSIIIQKANRSRKTSKF